MLNQRKASKSQAGDDVNNPLDSSDEEFVLHLKTGDVIQGRFLINSKIGEGSFGQVFKVIDQKNENAPYAMKVEEESDETSMLEREIKVLIELRKKVGFPQIKFYGQERGFTYCIMSLLGKNLESLTRKLGGSLSIGTIVRIGVQMVERIEVMHNCRFVHRDIKPDNFVLEVGHNPKIVNLIDFGLSKHYINSKGDHIPFVKKAGLIGTARYASVAAHEEMEQGRKDDLESIGYVLIYLATGSLPWMNLQIEAKELKYAKIHQLKKNTKVDTLCTKLPKCFNKFMSEVKGMEFKATPDYNRLKGYFQEEIENQNKGFTQPFQYDWERLSEYQSKKKHMTVHVMQTQKEQQIQTQKVSPKKQNAPQIDNQETFEQIMDEKKRQNRNSPKNKKNSIMINIVEPDILERPSQSFLNVPDKNHSTTLLQIPQFNSSCLIESYAPSVATSKINNYKKSEEVVSEGGLPIWEMAKVPGFQIVSKGVLPGIMQGIRKPSIVFQRRERKAHTQIDTIRTMSKTLVQPKSIQGDDEMALEGLE